MKIVKEKFDDPNVKRIYLYGAGSSGRRAIAKLINFGFDLSKVQVVDSNSKKWGSSFENFVIKEPDFMFKDAEGFCFITSYMASDIIETFQDMSYCSYHFSRDLIQFNFKFPKFNQEFQEIHSHVADLCNMDIDEQYTLYTSVKATESISSDLAEVGVYRGGSAKLMLLACKDPGKKMYLFDTFEGLPESQIGEGDLVKPGWLNDTSQEQVMRNIENDPRAIIVKGVFPDSVNESLQSVKFSVVHLDTDIYEGTLQGLKFFWPRMSPNGRIIIHDYNNIDCPGVKAAVYEFFECSVERVLEVADSQAVLIK